MIDKKTEIFEKMPVWKAVATLAVPAILSQLVTMIYNLADTFFIGQTGDPNKVAAVSYAFGAFMMLAAIGNLFGIGGGSLISRMLGEKRGLEAKHVSSYSVFGTIIVSLIYSVVVWILMDPILSLLGASADTIGYGRDYLFWTTVVGGVPTALGITIGHLLRSEGASKQASYGIAIGGAINIILDPLFIFVFRMDVAGAALATMLANVVALGYYLILISRLKNKTVLSFKPSDFRNDKLFVRQVMSVGLPAAAAVILAILANGSLFKVLSFYGDLPVAAMGIVKKIDMIPLNVSMGLAQGVLPLVAYNYAAKNFDRMKSISRFARVSGSLFAVLCIIVFQIFAPQLVAFFIDSPETIALGSTFLRIACLATPAMALFFLFNTTFQAMGRGKQSFILVLCRQLFINLPILFTLNAFFGMNGAVWTQLIADVIAVGIAALLFEQIVKQLKLEINQLKMRSV